MTEITSTWSATPSDKHIISKDVFSTADLWGGKLVVYVSDRLDETPTKFGILTCDIAVVGGTLTVNTLYMSVFGSGWNWLNCSNDEENNVVIDCDEDCVYSFRFQPSP